jgi:transcriptional regulator with XRE-family HTH domain
MNEKDRISQESESKRISQIMKEENLNASQFAESIGIQRAAISHILTGRNKPSLDVIKKILNKFSTINPDWLLYGEGPMRRNAQNYTNVPRNLSETDMADSTSHRSNWKSEKAASNNSTYYKNSSTAISRDLFSQQAQSNFPQSIPPTETRPTTDNHRVVADRNTNRTTSAQNSLNPADIRTEMYYAEEKMRGEEGNYAANQVKDVIKETIIYKERPNKTIEKLFIFYSDNTYEIFIPEKHEKHNK